MVGVTGGGSDAGTDGIGSGVGAAARNASVSAVPQFPQKFLAPLSTCPQFVQNEFVLTLSPAVPRLGRPYREAAHYLPQAQHIRITPSFGLATSSG
jgi:hypothetical protein